MPAKTHKATGSDHLINLQLNGAGARKVNVKSGVPKSKLHVEGSVGFKVVSKNSNYTAAEEVVIMVDASGGGKAITLPKASTAKGRTYYIKKIDGSGNNVIIAGDGAETIDGQASQGLGAQYNCMQVVCDGTAWHIISNK